jgi:hypothetical protein
MSLIIMKTFSTRETANRVGVHYITLHRWIAGKKVRASQSIRMNGHVLWRWTESDVEKVRKFKASNYRKGRGRKAKPKR